MRSIRRGFLVDGREGAALELLHVHGSVNFHGSHARLGGSRKELSLHASAKASALGCGHWHRRCGCDGDGLGRVADVERGIEDSAIARLQREVAPKGFESWRAHLNPVTACGHARKAELPRAITVGCARIAGGELAKCNRGSRNHRAGYIGNRAGDLRKTVVGAAIAFNAEIERAASAELVHKRSRTYFDVDGQVVAALEATIGAGAAHQVNVSPPVEPAGRFNAQGRVPCVARRRAILKDGEGLHDVRAGGPIRNLLAELSGSLPDLILECRAIALLVVFEPVLRQATPEFDIDLCGVGHLGC